MWRATSGETILGKEEVVATINESGVGESTVYKLPQRSSGGVFCCFRSPGSRYGRVEARSSRIGRVVQGGADRVWIEGFQVQILGRVVPDHLSSQQYLARFVYLWPKYNKPSEV